MTHQAVVQAIHYSSATESWILERLRASLSRAITYHGTEASVRDPKSLMGAQYSLPFATAVAVTRDLSNPLNYDEVTVRNPQVRDLARRIELIPVEESHHPEITIEFGGEVHTLAPDPPKALLETRLAGMTYAINFAATPAKSYESNECRRSSRPSRDR